MIKDIAVVLDGEGEHAEPAALALAAAVDASVTAVCVAATPFIPIAGFDGLSAELIAAAREEAASRAARVADAFTARARSCGRPAETVLVGDGEEPGPTLVDHLRTCDLIVIEQPDQRKSKPGDAHVDTVLFRSGRPGLIVPFKAASTAPYKRILIAWDESATAARAVGDALPLLRGADTVSVVSVSDREIGAWSSGSLLLKRLGRHGIDAGYHTIGSETSVADALMSHAADMGADLLVMGAYGHSPLREGLFGGVSHDVLRSAALPLFVAH